MTILITVITSSLQWRHNERTDVSNHQPRDCLLNRLFKVQIKENIKAPRHWPLWGEFTGVFPAQRASNVENVSIWWRHHVWRCNHTFPLNSCISVIRYTCKQIKHPFRLHGILFRKCLQSLKKMIYRIPKSRLNCYEGGQYQELWHIRRSTCGTHQAVLELRRIHNSEKTD